MDDKDLRIDKMTYDEYLRLVLLAETRNSATSSMVAFTLSLFKKLEKPAHETKTKPGKVGADEPKEPRRVVYIKNGKAHRLSYYVRYQLLVKLETRQTFAISETKVYM